MSESDVNTSAPSVDTNVEPEAGELQDPQINAENGQIQAIQAEREKRQAAERERDDALRAQEYYRNLAETQSEADNTAKTDPDDWATYGDVKSMISQEMGKVEQENKRIRNQEQFVAAKTRYKDFDEVFNFALEMAKNTPGLENAIMASANPAETAYRLGQTHESYLKKVKTKATADVVDKINEGMNTPQTLSNVGAANNDPKNEVEKMRSMSDEEFEKLVHRNKMNQ